MNVHLQNSNRFLYLPLVSPGLNYFYKATSLKCSRKILSTEPIGMWAAEEMLRTGIIG